MYDVLQPGYFFVNYNRADTRYGRQKILIIITILLVSWRDFSNQFLLEIIPFGGPTNSRCRHRS